MFIPDKRWHHGCFSMVAYRLGTTGREIRQLTGKWTNSQSGLDWIISQGRTPRRKLTPLPDGFSITHILLHNPQMRPGGLHVIQGNAPHPHTFVQISSCSQYFREMPSWAPNYVYRSHNGALSSCCGRNKNNKELVGESVIASGVDQTYSDVMYVARSWSRSCLLLATCTPTRLLTFQHFNVSFVKWGEKYLLLELLSR